MSLDKNQHEAERWLKTAKDDIESANILMTNGKYAHACFHCQQAAEKAVKAVWYLLDADPWGHSIAKLIRDIESVDMATYKKFESLKRSAVLLDRFYITTRYPNGLPDLTPEETYMEEDAKNCIENAEKIMAVSMLLIAH